MSDPGWIVVGFAWGMVAGTFLAIAVVRFRDRGADDE